MTLKEEFQTRNFSIYGQWLGILSMIICLAVGIANIFSFNVVRIIFCAFAIASAFVILFIEVPLLLRICPTSGKFDETIRKISTNYMRAAAYGVMSACSLLPACRYQGSGLCRQQDPRWSGRRADDCVDSPAASPTNFVALPRSERTTI